MLLLNEKPLNKNLVFKFINPKTKKVILKQKITSCLNDKKKNTFKISLTEKKNMPESRSQIGAFQVLE